MARTVRPADASDLDLLLQLDLRRGHLRHGLQAALRGAIQEGRLAPNTRLPASRRLADDLGVSRGVVADTYEQLVAEGYLHVAARRAPVVAAVLAPARTPDPVFPERVAPSFRYDFIATTPDVELFPRRAWQRATEAALREATNEALDYGDHRGRIELRTALAGYLGRVRGVRTSPDRIVITQGFTQALDLLCRVLRERGATSVWFESPSLAEEWATVAASGLRIRGVPVDRAGVRTDLLPDRDSAAIVVTPAHQFPTGAVLTPERRNALVAWARRHDGLIVEDDYDAESRYDRAAIGAVQGLDPDRVVHIGTASKALAPGLRLGWMSLPASLVGEIRQAKAATDSGSPAIDQLALAAFLERGDYDRQVVRVRGIYRERRDRLLRALAARLPGLSVEGVAAGLHVVLRLPASTDDAALAGAAASAGIGVRPLSPMFLGEPRDRGLVVGYGRLVAERIDDAVAALAEVVRAAG